MSITDGFQCLSSPNLHSKTQNFVLIINFNLNIYKYIYIYIYIYIYSGGIVSKNQIIKNFWFYWRGNNDSQLFKIVKVANVLFWRFPYFKVEICSKFALLTMENLRLLNWMCSLDCTLISSPTANSLQFTA